MQSIPQTIAPETVACISEGREPTPAELERVARRIHAELTGSRPAFSWGTADGDSSVALVSRRLAEATLCGSRK